MAKKRTRFHQSSTLMASPKAIVKQRRRWLTQHNAARLLKLGLLITDVVIRVLEACEKLKVLGK